MKKSTSIAIVSLFALAVTALIAKTEDETTKFNLSGPTTSELESRLNQLEQKIFILESENIELKESIKELQSVTITPNKNWQKREFNRESYYIIPTSGVKK